MKKFWEHFISIIAWVCAVSAIVSLIVIIILAALGYDDISSSTVLKCFVYICIVSGGFWCIIFLSAIVTARRTAPERRIVAALEELDKQLAEEEAKTPEPFEEFSNSSSQEPTPKNDNTVKQVSEETAKEIAYKFFGRTVNCEVNQEFDEAAEYHFKEGEIELIIISEYGGVDGESYPYGTIVIGNNQKELFIDYQELFFEYIDGAIKVGNPLKLQSDLAEVLSELLLRAINTYEDDSECPKIVDYEVVDEQPLYRALCLADEIKNRIPRNSCKNCNKRGEH